MLGGRACTVPGCQRSTHWWTQRRRSKRDGLLASGATAIPARERCMAGSSSSGAQRVVVGGLRDQGRNRERRVVVRLLRPVSRGLDQARMLLAAGRSPVDPTDVQPRLYPSGEGAPSGKASQREGIVNVQMHRAEEGPSRCGRRPSWGRRCQRYGRRRLCGTAGGGLLRRRPNDRARARSSP